MYDNDPSDSNSEFLAAVDRMDASARRAEAMRAAYWAARDAGKSDEDARAEADAMQAAMRIEDGAGPVGMSFPDEASELEYMQWVDDSRRNALAELDETRREWERDCMGERERRSA